MCQKIPSSPSPLFSPALILLVLLLSSPALPSAATYDPFTLLPLGLLLIHCWPRSPLLTRPRRAPPHLCCRGLSLSPAVICCSEKAAVHRCCTMSVQRNARAHSCFDHKARTNRNAFELRVVLARLLCLVFSMLLCVRLCSQNCRLSSFFWLQAKSSRFDWRFNR